MVILQAIKAKKIVIPSKISRRPLSRSEVKLIRSENNGSTGIRLEGPIRGGLSSIILRKRRRGVLELRNNRRKEIKKKKERKKEKVNRAGMFVGYDLLMFLFICIGCCYLFILVYCYLFGVCLLHSFKYSIMIKVIDLNFLSIVV